MTIPIEQQASDLLTKLIANGNKAKTIGAKIGKSAQWVGHYRSGTKFFKPMEPEVAQKILDTDWSDLSDIPIDEQQATSSVSKLSSTAEKYQTISDNARKVLQELLARGYSPADLANRFDSRPIAITTYASNHHWRGVPWTLATKVLEIDLDTIAPPKEVEYRPVTLF